MSEIHIYGPHSMIKNYPRRVLPVVDEVTSYPVQGAEWSKAYRKGLWDGRKRLFRKRTGAFPTGLVPAVREALEGLGEEVQIVDHRSEPVPSEQGFDLHGVTFDYPYDYQLDACKKMVEHKQGIVKAATNSGKTELACAVTQYLGLNTLFIVTTRELLYQARKRFMTRLQSDESQVGIIGDGNWYPGEWITIATLDTLESRMDTPECQDLLKNTEVLFMDEVHHLGSDTWFTVASLCQAYYRYGLSVGKDSMVAWRYKNEEKYTTIENLAEYFGVVSESDVSSFDIKVRAFDGKDFKWSKLNKIICHKTYEDLYKISTSYGKKLIVTEDHSLMKVAPGELDKETYRLTGHKSYFPKVHKATINECVVGDYLLTEFSEYTFGNTSCVDLYKSCKDLDLIVTNSTLKLKHSKKGHVQRYIPVKEFGYLLGWYIGDGWLDGNRVSFSVHKDQVQDFLSYNDFLLKSLKIKPQFSFRENRKCVEIRLGSKLLASVFSNLGFKEKFSNTKKLPEELWNWTKEGVISTIKGLAASDGSLAEQGNKKRYYYNTTSRSLALDVVHLLRKTGIVAGFSVSKNKPGGWVRGKQIIGNYDKYVVHWSFYGKQEGYKGSGRYPSLFTKNQIDGLPIIIKNIKKVANVEGQKVYDLVVQDTSTFVANGMLVHNSGTPLDRTDGADLRLIAAIGEKIVDIDNKFLVERGVSAKAHVIFDKVTEPTIKKKARYPTVYKQGVVENPNMLAKVVEWTKIFYEAGLGCLILCEEIQHGRLIDDALWTQTDGAFIPHQFIYGNESSETRQKALDDFGSRNLPVLISSTILDEGVDVPTIDALILAGSRKSRIRTMQRLGRGLRGQQLIVVDFANFCHKYLIEHSLKRMEDFKNEECFPVYNSEPDADLVKRIWEKE